MANELHEFKDVTGCRAWHQKAVAGCRSFGDGDVQRSFSTLPTRSLVDHCCQLLLPVTCAGQQAQGTGQEQQLCVAACAGCFAGCQAFDVCMGFSQALVVC